MLNKIINTLKSSSFLKKHLEPLVLRALEENFYFDKTITGHFADSSGRIHQLYSGFRDKVKPGWRAMLIPENQNRIPSRTELKSAFIEAKRKIRNFKNILRSFNVDLNNKSILEIGCFNGIKTFLFGLENCSSVTGADVSFYFKNQSDLMNDAKANDYLANYRHAVLELFNQSEKEKLRTKVKFIEDDISKSALPDNSFDIISSWETLEHIIDIDEALLNIKRILKPGGIAFHEYNPFFSLNGGHSLCTLDFPWGHCRLNNNDFIKYLEEFRPDELKLAQEFFFNSLNRLTIASLRKASEKAELKVIALIPFVKKAHLSIYNNKFLKEVTELYNDVELIDLISPVIWVLHQKNIDH